MVWENRNGEHGISLLKAYVRGKVARARGEVGRAWGIAAKATPGAEAAAAMPGVRRTPDRPLGCDARGVCSAPRAGPELAFLSFPSASDLFSRKIFHVN